MDTKREDARITRTKKELRNGLFALLKSKTFEKISVREVCEYSHINKMTFYKHYADKYDLLDDCVRSSLTEIYIDIKVSRGNKPLSLDEFPGAFAEMTINSLDKLLEHREAILSLSSDGDSFGAQIVRSSLEQAIARSMSRFAELYDLAYQKWSLSAFLAGGFTSLALRIVHEGSYDREYYFKRIQWICQLLLNGKPITDGNQKTNPGV